MVEENEAHHLAELKENGLESDGGRHKIGCFLGSEAANYKTNLTLKLNHTQFYPSSYAMPKEAARFKQGKSIDIIRYFRLRNTIALYDYVIRLRYTIT